MFCSDCGTPTRDDARFCHFCGTAVAEFSPRHSPADQRGLMSTTAPPSASRPAAATIVPPSPAPSRTLIVGGYLSVLWSVAILGLAAVNETVTGATLAAAVLFLAYGVALVSGHRSSVWLGWLICAGVLISTVASGFVPLLVLLGLGMAAWATYVHRTHRTSSHKEEEPRARRQRLWRRMGFRQTVV